MPGGVAENAVFGGDIPNGGAMAEARRIGDLRYGRIRGRAFLGPG
jgi:hypothetical protein